MKLLSDYEEYLIYAKIAGSLSGREEAECEDLLRNNALAAEEYQRLLQKLPPEDVSSAFSRFKDPAKWPDSYRLTGVLRKVKSTSTLRRLSVAAAAALLLGIAGTWWLQNGPTGTKNAAPFEADGIRLTLSGGQQIDLSRNKGVINSGTAQLTNSGTSLQYASPAGTGAAMNKLVVPNGMTYQITLSDSTKIWLNAATRLDFPFAFAGNTREVTIEGEAYFEVAPMPGKPFFVHLPNSTVQVLGTRFNVNSYDTGTDQVALVEGAVRMKAGAQDLQLAPGRAGTYQAGKGLSENSFDQQKVLAWREGLFYFKNASMQEISRVIRRWYGLETRIDNAALQQRKFTGVIDKNQPVHIFQNNLKAISGIDSYLDAGNILHFK
ncbi:FecR family protein [Chitinophaga cymbidii]|uniref:Iron dicitrate transporter FecR n=1 Tax=Chitinophaga cymbidii TaxID=1096750 RepID=A0A512RPL7_9BACT|nr:FecR domain-containing protein [Chitinophaga cymbidii]GEP97643.1 iron dicitrate transporter FecR [Chitinophaga cymbidii]